MQSSFRFAKTLSGSQYNGQDQTANHQAGREQPSGSLSGEQSRVSAWLQSSVAEVAPQPRAPQSLHEDLRSLPPEDIADWDAPGGLGLHTQVASSETSLNTESSQATQTSRTGVTVDYAQRFKKRPPAEQAQITRFLAENSEEVAHDKARPTGAVQLNKKHPTFGRLAYALEKRKLDAVQRWLNDFAKLSQGGHEPQFPEVNHYDPYSGKTLLRLLLDSGLTSTPEMSELLQVLLQLGASPMQPQIDDLSPLEVAMLNIRRRPPVEVLSLLINVDIQARNGGAVLDAWEPSPNCFCPKK